LGLIVLLVARERQHGGIRAVHGKEKLSKEPVKNEPTFFYKQERH
jgi:hypothetical protein